jgi:hypothetical protein
MKQSGTAIVPYRLTRRGKRKVSDIVWETFDGLFKTLHRQGRRVEELEQRVVELERRLQERASQTTQPEAVERISQMPTEKAA